jgi:hypothetical protein
MLKTALEAKMRWGRLGFAVAVATTLIGFGGAAHAGLVYVGDWQVDSGPEWTTVPPAYSGQEAAALLFGGTPGEYVISTVNNNPADANDEAWVSTWGGACAGAFPCGTQVAQNSVVSTGGLYESPGDTSAYVDDWAVGSQYTNYAFLVTAGVPEPASWAMLLAGVGFVGGGLRLNRRKPMTLTTA